MTARGTRKVQVFVRTKESSSKDDQRLCIHMLIYPVNNSIMPSLATAFAHIQYLNMNCTSAHVTQTAAR